MNKLINFTKRNFFLLLRMFLFILTVVIIVYLFPKEGKFRYEFQKGKPWLHETLIAPFNVPIYKTESELASERDSILKRYKPYFLYDSSVLFTQLQNFSKEFNEKWDIYFKDSTGQYCVPKKKKDNYYFLISELFRFTYSLGIVEQVDVLDAPDSDCTVVVLINNVAEEHDCQDIFTQKTAYEYVHNNILKEIQEQEKLEKQFIYERFIKSLNIDGFITPNLLYDEYKSLNVRAELINEIPLTRGMVQADQRIISKGDVVDEESFRVLESLRYEYLLKIGTSNNFLFILGGQVILVFTSVLMLFLFLSNFRKEILNSTLKTSFILLLFVLMIILASLAVKSSRINLYVIPFAIVPIIIRTFYDSRLALYIHMIAILLVGFFAPNGFEFVFLSFIGGTVAIYSLSNLYRRSKLFLTSVLVVLAYSFVYFGMAIIQEGDLDGINWKNFTWFGWNGLLILTAYPLIYFFEKAFGFISDATLMELADTNQSLLRKLAEEAPGTFQHSMQVASLAEAAIFQIGGNPLLVRAGALYHDIGKLKNPIYFVENQHSGTDPHDNLDYDESAMAIINHVSKGIQLAKKYKLPKQIIDFIATHQGTTKVKYFYQMYIKKYPEKEVDISKFVYPGPKPYSKETAVLMMADSIEAASRALKEFTTKNIDILVENIINYQQIEEQFNDANITFKDITTIKRVFKKKLENIYHARIEYPK